MEKELWNEAIEVIKNSYKSEFDYWGTEIIKIFFEDETANASISIKLDDSYVFSISSVNDDFYPHAVTMNRKGLNHFIDIICDAQYLGLTLFDINEIIENESW